MHITIFAAGSRGDVQPCVVLGRELQRAGFAKNFSGFVQEQGLCFQPPPETGDR